MQWMKREAFTLIELLVVIAIIAILLAGLTPLINIGYDRVFTEQCTVRLKSIWVASRMYLSDYDAYPSSLNILKVHSYVDALELNCSKTGQQFIYVRPSLTAPRGQLMCACVAYPDTPIGKRPHGFGKSVVVLRVGGEVRVERGSAPKGR